MDYKDILIKVDGLSIQPEDKLDDSQINILLTHKLITQSVDLIYKVSFVGCIEVKGRVIISLPYGVSINQLSRLSFLGLRSYIIKIIECIRIFERHFIGENEIVSSGKIAASFSLIEDFEENGFITKFIKENSINGTGSIDWKRTIKKFQPFKISDSWVHKNLVTRSNTNHENHELILVQKWALNQATKYSSLLSDEHQILEDELECNLSRDEVTEIVMRLYPKSNKDREIYVLDLILQLLDEQEGTEFSAIYTKSFNLIWEETLQQVLGHNQKLKDKAPRVMWNDDHSVNEELEIKSKPTGSAPQVDIIFENEDRLYIFDAKYYDIINNGNRPGLTDLYKQFYYGEAFKAILGLSDLPENGLIFPCYMPNQNDYLVKFTDVEYLVRGEGYLNKITKIPAYVASIEKTIDAFLFGQSLKKYLLVVTGRTVNPLS
ncbi:LlaJI family restriction endonuclease [Colwellia echini]|uniref:LlaJI family restriction endonuclease n=1 Tax=Colwellia echini TaxID=1982103 RepID=A0ABY3MXT2_9GAMM|nr:LlaJI family restriction endonuclease [Colwellia echini]TYK66031.1 LlaJI family restriction endonuclease [Colwellia echini]